ncbi:MAG: hypothetical protein ABIR54_07495 [Burkholderiaceae bacterium]
MRHSVLSFVAAGVLLVAGAHAVDADDSAATAAPAFASAPHAKASEAASAKRTVKIFVTVRDDAGKVLKVSVRIEADDGADIGVGADGGKLSLPAGGNSTIKVLYPGGNCDVTLTPKLLTAGRVAIGVKRGAAGPKCALEDSAQAGKPASAPAAHVDSSSDLSSVVGSLF